MCHCADLLFAGATEERRAVPGGSWNDVNRDVGLMTRSVSLELRITALQAIRRSVGLGIGWCDGQLRLVSHAVVRSGAGGMSKVALTLGLHPFGQTSLMFDVSCAPGARRPHVPTKERYAAMNGGKFVYYAKQAKHRGFVLAKHARWRVRPYWYRIVDRTLILMLANRPFVFKYEDYSGEFVAWPTGGDLAPGRLPNQMFLFWLGGTELSENRRRALDVVRELNPDVAVNLITDENLHEYIRQDHPLHATYTNLALTHKSDYLRAYFMHYYGGGYLDVKTIKSSWVPAFQRLRENKSAWVLGYRELSHATASTLPGRMQSQVRKNFFRIIGNGAFICKPESPITSEWLAEVERRLAYYEQPLKIRPGGIRGGEATTEVVPKHALLGGVFGALNLKYHEHLIIDDSIAPDFQNYL